MHYCQKCDTLTTVSARVAGGVAAHSGAPADEVAERSLAIARALAERINTKHEADGHDEERNEERIENQVLDGTQEGPEA